MCYIARTPLPRGASANGHADHLGRLGAVPKAPAANGYASQTWSGNRAMLSTPNPHQAHMQVPPEGYFYNGLPVGSPALNGGAAMYAAGAIAAGENCQMSVDSGSKRTRDVKPDKKTDKKYGVCAPTASMV